MKLFQVFKSSRDCFWPSGPFYLVDYINRYPDILNSFYILGTSFTWPQGFLLINFCSVIANMLLFLNLHTYERLFSICCLVFLVTFHF